MEHWRVIRTPAPWKREVRTPTIERRYGASAFEVRTRAELAMDRLDRVLTGCRYWGSGLYAQLPPGGCPCRATRSPGLRRTSVDAEYASEARAAILANGLQYSSGGRILSVR